MNKVTIALAAFAVSLGLAGGCDEKKADTGTPAPAASSGTNSKPTDAAKTDSAAAPKAADPKKDAAPAGNTPPAGSAMMGSVNSAAADAKGKAMDLYNQLEKAVADKKWPDASALVEKLKSMQDSLPPEVKTKFAALQKEVEDQLKTKLMDNIPGLGGGK